MRASNVLWRVARPRISTSNPASTSASISLLSSANAAQCLVSSFRSLPRPARIGLRYKHSSANRAVKEDGMKALPARWLSDLKARVGKCIMFGLKEEQLGRAGAILATVGQDWRELVVGSEGFLTSKERAGLLCHNVVWGEMDSMGHVNNVTYVRYAESARVNWAYNIGINVDPAHKKEWSTLLTPNGYGLILRSIRTDYKFPMTWPDKVSVFHKLRELPTAESTAFHLDVMIMSERHQRPSARCVEDIVVYDYKVGKKSPMQPFMLDVFRDLYRQQEEAKMNNTARVLDLLQQVEILEKESWDREGAKEDLGSAA